MKNSIAASLDLPFELMALKEAVRYQQWIFETIQSYLGKRILELGAGIGNMSSWFINAERLVLTEYDTELLQLLSAHIQDQFPDAKNISMHQLDISKESLSSFQQDHIDTIVSFNVLEHIEKDDKVLHHCAELLRQSQAPGKKRIITFVPAHPWAYGTMDKAVGHYRRYNKKMLIKLHQQITPDAKLILLPFNFCGLWGWAINGHLLRRKCAGVGMINLVEKLCPLFKSIDKFLIHTLNIPLGQSLLCIQEWS